MSRMGGVSGFTVPQYRDDPEETGGFGVAGQIMSGAGNLLGLPGSMVRDAVMLRNPFDQLMTPFSDENRTSGAEMSSMFLGGDQNSGGNQLAGLIAEVLSDPLMLATGGTTAAGRAALGAGKAAMKAGGRVAGAAKSGYKAGRAANQAERAAKVGPIANRANDLATRNIVKTQERMAQAQPALQSANTSADMLGPYFRGSQYGPTRAQGEALREMGRIANQGAARQSWIDDTAQSMMKPTSLDRMMGIARPAAGGGFQGARQFGDEAYQGVASGIQSGYGTAMDTIRGAMGGNRANLAQLGAVAPASLRTMMGENRQEEPSIDELIAMLMEDPSMMEY